MNPNLDKWIVRSIVTSFLSHTEVENLHVFLEGQHRDTSKLPEFLELRIDGPWYRQHTKGIYTIRIEVNVLVVVNFAKSNQPSIYRIRELSGYVASILERGFTITNEDEERIGCMEAIQKNRDYTKTSHFGQIEPQIRILQSTVETAYQMGYKDAT